MSAHTLDFGCVGIGERRFQGDAFTERQRMRDAGYQL